MHRASAPVRIVHARVPGRVRYAVTAMRRNSSLASSVERLLRAEPGVHEVRAEVLTGTLLVLFEPRLSHEVFDQLLSRALDASVSKAPPATTVRRSSRAVAVAARTLQSLRGGARSVRKAWTLPQLPQLRRSQPTAVAVERTSERVAWHTLELGEVCLELEVEQPTGLTTSAAELRLQSFGTNTLPAPPRRSELEILLGQLTSTPVIMLGASALLSVATGGVADAVAILAVVGINAAIGYATESGAERSIAALSRTPHPFVPVRRDGRIQQVAVEQIVRGDLLVLAAGIFVAADARIVAAEELTVDESSLTGESVPVLKSAQPMSESSVPLAERVSMVYRGTLVTGGSGLAVVIATGVDTEIGHIHALATSVAETQTPMQQQLDHLGRQLAAGASIACAATLGVGLLRGQAPLPMFRTAVSLAVAAVPEGLPTVAITTLALGLKRMRAQRVVVRRLSAVETLGAVQAVCVDKTGTVTVNRMTVTAVQAGLDSYDVRAGVFVGRAGETGAFGHADLQWLLRLGVLCSEVNIEQQNGVVVLEGSPTESAIVQLAFDAGLDVRAVRTNHARVSIQARSETRSYMMTQHVTASGGLRAVKGRPSEVLALCGSYLKGGERFPLGDAERAHIENDNEHMAGRALRMLGVAFTDRDGELAGNLVWVGLVGMHDPPREGVGDVIARFRRAGIRTIMITGDQSATAHAVGKQIGLSSNGHLEIVDSTRLDQVGPEVLSALAQRADVFSRVSPAHKLQIVQALQRAGLVVAMTGDGVNDSPALKAADIGIAMGGGGTTAAREVADVVLEDDELQTLVTAIEQGRTIYDDLRKAVRFILSTNLGEILYTFTCVAAGLGEPLSPMQLLWINLLTDVLPELALAVQPPEADVLDRQPRDPARPMFTRTDLARIGVEGGVITAGALGAYLWSRARSGGGAHANSVGFTALTLAQLMHAWSARSEVHTIFDREQIARNRWLPLAVGGTMLLQVAANLTPPLRTLLGTIRLSAGDWATVAVAAIVPFIANETIKLAQRPERAADERASHNGAPRLLPSPAE
jgi:Ca2+-transporting ATPase